jgi:signal transduction histidine kinase/FixJ family two-component response regulator
VAIDLARRLAEEGHFMGQEQSNDGTAPSGRAEQVARTVALLALGQMTDQPTDDIATFALENVIAMTGSSIGYIAFVNDDETVLTMHYWSKSAMQECAIIDKPIVYPLENTGLWGEAVRQRRPVITNDYAAPNAWKKGMPSGHVRVVRHMNVPVFDGGKIVAVAGVGNKKADYTNDDVREMTLIMDGMWRIFCRKRAEDSLRQRAEELRAVVANVPAAIFQFYARPNGEMGLYSLFGALAETLGFTTSDERLFERFMELVDPRDMPGLVGSIHAAIAEFKPWCFEWRVAAPDENTLWFSGTSTPMQRANEIVFSGLVIDITSRKAAEEESHRYAQALEASNKAMEEAKREAETANRVKSEFLANMSHEIRTPMTAILGYADILAENVYDREGIEAADTIRRNANFLLDIINNILDLSKIEAGKMQVERIAHSPVSTVAEVASLMRVRADAKRLTISTVFEGPIPETIQTDPVRLRQILFNLVGNAVKFTDFGEIRIVTSVRREEGKPALMQFDVIDTGIGMSPEQIGVLFRPFSQAGASSSRRFGGSGLGLAISKRLANLLGGDICVDSQPGRTSTFSVTIDPGPLDGVPMLLAPAEAATESISPREPAHANAPQLEGRVLLAEDGPDNQRLIAFLLRKAGAEVAIVENGQAAVDAVVAGNSPSGETESECRGPFDVILMDMQMPLLDGYAATRRLRSMGYGGPIIALTAHAMIQDRQKCLDAGCDDYLAKPVDRSVLIETVARYLLADYAQPSAASESCSSSG